MSFLDLWPQVKKIVEGQFELFRNMYKPLVEEYATNELLSLSACGDHQMNIHQVCLDFRVLKSQFNELI